LAAFLHIEAASGVLLVVAAVAALVWANVAHESYESFWGTVIELRLGDTVVKETLHDWVSDGLMALFFFVVGLEIKRELVVGELRDPRTAALPAVAALGGMVVPALLFVALNAGTDTSRGWGIPMATDIAFALGVVALLGTRVPAPLKLFLLSLAIVDDLGAILVIAVAYTEDVSLGWLAIAALAATFTIAARRVRVWYTPVYVFLGLALWFAMLESGVHATIAGVLFGLLTPARPLQHRPETDAIVDTLENRAELTADDVQRVSASVRESVSVAERYERVLHPWTSFVIVPLFALANAGIDVSSSSFDLGSPLMWGIVLGLVVGKPLGITLFSWVAVRLRIARLPDGVGFASVLGVGAVAGIGFTVALFIADLAFVDPSLTDEAKLAILVASVLAAAVGTLVAVLSPRRRPGSAVPEELSAAGRPPR
jgi:NhaA family Na+:H+ antiporter